MTLWASANTSRGASHPFAEFARICLQVLGISEFPGVDANQGTAVRQATHLASGSPRISVESSTLSVAQPMAGDTSGGVACDPSTEGIEVEDRGERRRKGRDVDGQED